MREQRIEQRHEFTSTCQEKGADGEGIARATNGVYNGLFGTRPAGDRDDWTIAQQKAITVGEHFATRRVEELNTPDEGSDQWSANDAVVEQARSGARDAREYITNQTENGNWWTRLFND